MGHVATFGQLLSYAKVTQRGFPNMVKMNMYEHWTQVTRFNPLGVSGNTHCMSCCQIIEIGNLRCTWGFPNMVKMNMYEHWTQVTGFNPLWVSGNTHCVSCCQIIEIGNLGCTRLIIFRNKNTQKLCYKSLVRWLLDHFNATYIRINYVNQTLRNCNAMNAKTNDF